MQCLVGSFVVLAPGFRRDRSPVWVGPTDRVANFVEYPFSPTEGDVSLHRPARDPVRTQPIRGRPDEARVPARLERDGFVVPRKSTLTHQAPNHPLIGRLMLIKMDGERNGTSLVRSGGCEVSGVSRPLGRHRDFSLIAELVASDMGSEAANRLPCILGSWRGGPRFVAYVAGAFPFRCTAEIACPGLYYGASKG